MTYRRDFERQNKKAGATVRKRQILHAALLLMGIMATVGAQAQTKAEVRCTGGRKLSLDTLTRLIQLPTKEQVLINQIEACHVDFALDEGALRQLTQTGAPGSIMDALDQDTASQLTAEQARTQAEGLKSCVADAQLRSACQARVEFLKKQNYSDPRQAAVQQYDAASSQLKATIGAEEYWFDKVPGDTSQTLLTNWKQVKVVEPFAATAWGKRVLVLASSSLSIPGYAHAAKMEALEEATHAGAAMLRDADLTEGKRRMERHSFEEAATAFQNVLAIDPRNADAQAGLEAAKAGQREQSEQDNKLREKGVWLDRRTGLMWTASDNGKKTDLGGANAYCRALRTGSFVDWRLPTIEELEPLYDPRSGRRVLPNALYPIHILGGIMPTGPYVWMSQHRDADAAYAEVFSFVSGGKLVFTQATPARTSTANTTQDSDLNDFQKGMLNAQKDVEKKMKKLPSIQESTRTLCVRSDSTVIAESVPIAITRSAPSGASLDALLEIGREADAISSQRRYKEALPLYASTCARGAPESCRVLGSLYSQGDGLAAKDELRGAELAAEGCGGGSGRSCEILSDAYRFGQGVLRSSHKAFEMSSVACDAGFALGCSWQANMYATGTGVEQDKEKARTVYAKACSAGDKASCDSAARLGGNK